MTATNLDRSPSVFADASKLPRFFDVVRSEWVKLSSLGSTWFALAGMWIIGFGGGFSTAFRPAMSSINRPPDVAVTMYDLTMVAGAICPVFAGILGVLCIGNEYSSGTIRSTLLASPTRLRVLMAKALLLFALTGATAAVMIIGAWAASNPIHGRYGYQAPLSAPGVVGALLGVIGYLALTSVFGLGVGAIVRSNTAGAIIIFVTTFLGPALSMMLPPGLFSTLTRAVIIGNGGYSMVQIAPDGAPFANLHGYLSPPAGVAIVLGWTIVALGVGAVLLRRRDA